MATNSRLKELKGALKDVLASNDQIVEHVEANREEGGPEVQVEVKHVEAFRSGLAKAREIRSEIEALEGHEEVKAWATASSAPAVASKQTFSTSEAKSLGQRFIESDEFKSIQGGRNGYTMNAPYQVKDIYSELPTGTPSQFGTPQREGIVERAKRASRVRDLFAVQQTNTNMIEYFRVSGFTNNAAARAERNAGDTAYVSSAQSSMTVVGVQAPVRTIAHFEVAHRNVLDDEPTLRGIIDSELLYGLRLVEDDQILNGDGTGSNLTGIRNTSGIQTLNWSAGVVGDSRIDAVRRGITKALLAYYEPTGVIVHPNDMEDIELTKDDENRHIMVMSVSLGAEARLWRLPMVSSPAITEGKALVGSFGIGATLYDRMEGTIRMAEERIALAVKRPESFVEVSFDNAPS
jgi:HK97 family phage major capsid protein